MSRIDRAQLFDSWADSYDPAAVSAEDDFPFAGYEAILDKVISLGNVRPAMRVLDIGIGTGNLAARFLDKNCLVWGIDFSAQMLAKTRAKLPQAKLVGANLLDGLPLNPQVTFDRVVSAYVLHEFDLETKIRLLQRIAANYLSPGGRILIADIAFPNVSARVDASQWAAYWDEDEHYWAADETIAASRQAGLSVAYKQLSCCGGVFVFTVEQAG